MFRKPNKTQDEVLDRAGRQILKASVLAAGEAERFASSPFLLTGIRARIAEKRAAEEINGIWAGVWFVSKRALPVMGLAAAISLGLFVRVNRSPAPAFSVDAYLREDDSNIESIVFAGERRPLTGDEVLATIVDKDDHEATK